MDSGKFSTGDTGSEVERLQMALVTLGQTVSPHEIKRRFFGPTTREAVMAIQKRHGLPPTGQVNSATARALDTSLGVSNGSAVESSMASKPASSAGSGSGMGMPVPAKAPADAGVSAPSGNAKPIGTVLADPVSAARAHTEARLSKLREILGTSPAAIARPALDKFLALLTESPGSGPEFWAGAARESGLADNVIDDIRFTLELSAVTRQNLPLMTELQRLHKQGTIQGGRDLARFSPDDWKSFIKRASPGSDLRIPADVPGDTAGARLDAYVNEIEAGLRKAYPTRYVVKAFAAKTSIDAQIVKRVLAANAVLDPTSPKVIDLSKLRQSETAAAESAIADLRREIKTFPDFDHRSALASLNAGATEIVNPIRVGVSQFFANAPDFDFRGTNIDKYIADNPKSMNGVKEPVLVTAQLKRMHRVFRVAPDAKAMDALQGEGLHSASRITAVSAEAFMARFRDKLGGHVAAAKAYAAARSVTATVAAITWAARLRSAGPLPAAVGTWPPPDLQVGNAELKRLLDPGGSRPRAAAK